MRCPCIAKPLAVSVLALLGACGSAPPAVAPVAGGDDAASTANPGSAASTAAAFEQRLRERAVTQARQGRLAEAALSWEVLSVLRPDSAEYKEQLTDVRRLSAAAVQDHQQRGAQAFKRGELDAATTQYLSALALQPDQAAASEALRNIERERNRRYHLGKPSSLTASRRAAVNPPTVRVAPRLPLDRNEVEHAAMLATQGEFDDAIALLRRHLSLDRGDVVACQMLADIYYRKGERLIGKDKPGAIDSFEKSLRLDEGNVRAAARLKQLKGNGAGGGGSSSGANGGGSNGAGSGAVSGVGGAGGGLATGAMAAAATPSGPSGQCSVLR